MTNQENKKSTDLLHTPAEATAVVTLEYGRKEPGSRHGQQPLLNRQNKRHKPQKVFKIHNKKMEGERCLSTQWYWRVKFRNTKEISLKSKIRSL